MTAESSPATLKCPVDGGFITDFRGDYARGICQKCGGEVTFRSREERRRDTGRQVETPEANERFERTVATRGTVT